MPTPHRIVGETAREEVTAGDLVRMQVLASKAIQDQAMYQGAGGDGVPFSSLEKVPSWTPTGGTNNVVLGAGAGHAFSAVGVGADDSSFQVIEWPSQTISFGAADPTNPRIDLVVVALATAQQDLEARNTLVDPVTRSEALQNVVKTLQPASTISVVAGTPAGTPAPPAVPANTYALFEVLVPAAAADSSSFLATARMFRRCAWPATRRSGVVSGDLSWNSNVDPSTTTSPLLLSGSPRYLIDGELVSAEVASPTGPLAVIVTPVSDAGGNNPFAAAAPSGNDKPYYIYAVGGRHSPQGVGGIAVVESLVAPDLTTGRPSAPITTPRGDTTASGAVYIGIGFVVANSTRRRACLMNDDYTYVVADGGAEVVQLTKTGSGSQALPDLASKPAVSRRLHAGLLLTCAGTGVLFAVYPDRGDGGGPAPGVAASQFPMAGLFVLGPTSSGKNWGTVYFNPSNKRLWTGGAGSALSTGDVLQLSALAYDHRVQRI